MIVAKPGPHPVEIECAGPAGIAGSHYTVCLDEAKPAGVVQPTGTWTSFQAFAIGSFAADEAGRAQVAVRVQCMPKNAVMNLKAVRLTPAL